MFRSHWVLDNDEDHESPFLSFGPPQEGTSINRVGVKASLSNARLLGTGCIPPALSCRGPLGRRRRESIRAAIGQPPVTTVSTQQVDDVQGKHDLSSC